MPAPHRLAHLHALGGKYAQEAEAELRRTLKNQGSVTKAAKALGVSDKSLWRWISSWKLDALPSMTVPAKTVAKPKASASKPKASKASASKQKARAKALTATSAANASPAAEGPTTDTASATGPSAGAAPSSP